ncbi:hypothetical protein ACJX0J_026737, partial [Zea mays]
SLFFFFAYSMLNLISKPIPNIITFFLLYVFTVQLQILTIIYNINLETHVSLQTLVNYMTAIGSLEAGVSDVLGAHILMEGYKDLSLSPLELMEALGKHFEEKWFTDNTTFLYMMHNIYKNISALAVDVQTNVNYITTIIAI